MPQALIDSAIIQYTGSTHFYSSAHSYNRSSKESAEWQAAIVLLLIKDNKNKVAIFQMKVFSYNCVCSTFFNPLT